MSELVQTRQTVRYTTYVRWDGDHRLVPIRLRRICIQTLKSSPGVAAFLARALLPRGRLVTFRYRVSLIHNEPESQCFVRVVGSVVCVV